MGAFPDCTRNCSFFEFYLFISCSPEDGVVFRPRSPPGNLCQKVHLLIQCALSSISPLKKGKGPETALQIGAGCLQSHRAGARVFLRASQTSGLKMPQHEAAAHRHQMFYTAHQLGSGREGFCFSFPRRRSWAPRARRRLQPFLLFAVTAGLQTREEDNIVFAHVRRVGEKKYRAGGGEEQRGETSET